MKRVLAALCALAGASGCYGTTYVETPAPQYGTTMEYIPEGPPPPISVTMAPPAPRYEAVLTCGYGTIYVPGRWEFSGRWYWARGYCSPVRPGHIYVGPRFIGGVYHRAHWAPSGYGAPAYPGGTVVAPPVYRPAPVYGGPTVVNPPPPVYRSAPVYGGPTVVNPPPVYRPAPTYGGPTVVAPPAPVAPSPVYRPAPVYAPPTVVSPPPARPYGAPAYTPPPAGGGYRPPPSYPGSAPAPMPPSGGYRPPPPAAPAPSGGYRPAPSAPSGGSPPPFRSGGPTTRVPAPGAGL